MACISCSTKCIDPTKSNESKLTPFPQHVIAASGDGQVNIGGYGLLASLADQILNRIPDSTNVTLPYPKADTRGVYKTEEGVSDPSFRVCFLPPRIRFKAQLKLRSGLFMLTARPFH